MRWPLLTLLLLLSGCSPVRHSFTVDVADAAQVDRAVVSICGEPEVALEKNGNRFSGHIDNQCEGSGYVRVRYKDGTTTNCPVGYVTTIEDRWAFTASRRSCEQSATA